MTNPRPTQPPTHSDHITSTREVYDFSAAHYASAVGTTVTAAFERPIDRAILNAFSEDLVAVNHALVLDIGCGVGRVTSYLHERGPGVRGIDLSPEMIASEKAQALERPLARPTPIWPLTWRR